MTYGDIFAKKQTRTRPKSEGGKHEQQSGQLHAVTVRSIYRESSPDVSDLRFARSLNPCDK